MIVVDQQTKILNIPVLIVDDDDERDHRESTLDESSPRTACSHAAISVSIVLDVVVDVVDVDVDESEVGGLRRAINNG